MKQFHLIGTDVRVRPQSIKISLLNVREIKDARAVRTYLSTEFHTAWSPLSLFEYLSTEQRL